ncbi:MAG: hypothetical protein QHH10_08430 [Peptococcaceae bacterium]|jgi:hypothetical protein|nr:hypothetical protein [Peptococcaceae bacterium]MDH7525321.1 hypothetical protein [Peptococcaceae bacterium]
MDGLAQDRKSLLTVAYNLSGALEAVKMGRFIILVDVIDMSTTLEALEEAGAAGLWGAAPAGKGLPYANPYLVGRAAAREAREKKAKIAVVAEPRAGSNEERKARAADVLAGIEAEGLQASGVWPNLGAETAKLADWRETVAVAVTDAGGTIFDAVWQMGGRVTTATVARTMKMKGAAPAWQGIKRALKMAQGAPLTLVAASGSALEDVLAVQYLAQLILARSGQQL